MEISPDLTLGRGAILTIAPSAVDPRVTWVGSDDGTMQITRRGGRTWTRVTPRSHEAGQVVHIEGSTTDAAAAVAFFRNGDENGTLRVIATQDYGRTWEDLAEYMFHGLRDGPVALAAACLTAIGSSSVS